MTAWETWNCFPESTSYFVRYRTFEELSLITKRYKKWCIVCCDPKLSKIVTVIVMKVDNLF